MKRTQILLLLGSVPVVLLVSAFQKAAPARSADPVVAGFEKATVASVADAVDQIVGRKGFLPHDVRPVVAGRMVGRATTAVTRPAKPEESTPALSTKYTVGMIDEAKPGEVGVIKVDESLDIAALGGLMGTTAKARGMAGMLVDGSVRDVAELRAMGLQVYARGIVPSSTVGRWASYAKGVPIEFAGGVTIRPGDVIVADEDGVVVVPKEHEAAVLKRSQEIDKRETEMVPFIKQFRSLAKTVEKFNRI